MASTEIFLVFPVYEDALNTPHYINKVNLKPATYYDKYISIIYKILEVFGIENYIGYYDSDNIDAFLLPINIVEDYYPNIRTRFRRLMSLWGENWRNYSKQEEADSFYYFSTPIKNDTFCEATKRQHINKSNSCLIINNDAFSCMGDVIETKYKHTNYSINVVSPDIKKIAFWFSLNRHPKRIYNWNPKHGENGKGAFKSNKGDKVSVLMCSNEEVPIMLNLALGNNPKLLHYYDCKHHQYIEFKQESENVYHAFHLDYDDEYRIPRNIKSIIDEICE